MTDMVAAFIGLGSNLNDPQAQLDRAVAILSRTHGIEVRQVSSYYCTRPWGDTAQPDFINAVMQVETHLAADVLMDTLIQIEVEAGRVRERRWGPRTLDLDLLLYGDTVRDTPQLQLPHPRMHERRFVLEPLAELAPTLMIPGHGRVDELLAQLAGDGVQRLDATSHLK